MLTSSNNSNKNSTWYDVMEYGIETHFDRDKISDLTADCGAHRFIYTTFNSYTAVSIIVHDTYDDNNKKSRYPRLGFLFWRRCVIH